jgi:hypothetical protein
MKRNVFLIVFIIIGFHLCAQPVGIKNENSPHYFIINSNPGVEITKVELSSGPVSECDQNTYHAELYNVHLTPGRLLLFTLLPTGKDFAVHWKPIDITNMASYILSGKQLDSIHFAGIEKFKRSGFRNRGDVKMEHINLIKKVKDSYYTNEGDCLTELFVTQPPKPNSGFANQTPFCFIDTSNVALTIRDFESSYLKISGSYSYNYDRSEGYISVNQVFNIPLLILAKKKKVLDLDAYYFWTLDTWSEDGKNSSRGVDRLVYNPTIGIIAGEYTSYFRKLFPAYQSPNCEHLRLNSYLDNRVKLMPVRITRNAQSGN